MITVESLTLMHNSDVKITRPIAFEGGVTKVTLESLTLVDNSDVTITRSTLCERGVTFIAGMYFLTCGFLHF